MILSLIQPVLKPHFPQQVLTLYLSSLPQIRPVPIHPQAQALPLLLLQVLRQLPVLRFLPPVQAQLLLPPVLQVQSSLVPALQLFPLQ